MPLTRKKTKHKRKILYPTNFTLLLSFPATNCILTTPCFIHVWPAFYNTKSFAAKIQRQSHPWVKPIVPSLDHLSKHFIRRSKHYTLSETRKYKTTAIKVNRNPVWNVVLCLDCTVRIINGLSRFFDLKLKNMTHLIILSFSFQSLS